MNVGMLDKRVALARCPQRTDDADGFWEPLTPEFVAAAIQPLSPAGDGRTTTHQVIMRYHAQVTVDTRMQYVDPKKGYIRELFVRGVQDVNERHETLVLTCEEVTP